jgi:hypothetical protein
MPMYHAEPNRSEPNRWMWFSVETPSVFKEYRLPASSADWSAADQRKFIALSVIADEHATYVHRSGYRRG